MYAATETTENTQKQLMNPLFIAIGTFISMALLFMMGVLFLPKLPHLELFNARLVNNDDFLRLTTFVMNAIDERNRWQNFNTTSWEYIKSKVLHSYIRDGKYYRMYILYKMFEPIDKRKKWQKKYLLYNRNGLNGIFHLTIIIITLYFIYIIIYYFKTYIISKQSWYLRLLTTQPRTLRWRRAGGNTESDGGPAKPIATH